MVCSASGVREEHEEEELTEEGSHRERPLPTDPEPVWSRWLAEQMGGVAEYQLPCRGRVDILTDTLACEVEWVKKGYGEAIGQAVYYGLMTERQPAIILLLRGKPTEAKYLERAKLTAGKLHIPVFTWMTT